MSRTFDSEEARLAALESVPEDEEHLAEIDEIIGAEIVAGSSEHQDVQQQSGSGQQQVTDDVETVPRSELPAGYKSFADVLKSFREKEDLIQRQTAYIQGHQMQAPAPASTKAPAQTAAAISAGESRLAEINGLLGELKAVEDPYDEDSIRKIHKLVLAQSVELNRLNTLYSQAQNEIGQFRGTAESYIQKQRADEESSRMRAAYSSEMSEMDGFAKKHPEYKMSKPAQEIDQEYDGWRKGVSQMYYGKPATTSAQITEALRQLRIGNPNLIDACRKAGFPTQELPEWKPYLDICRLLDGRDGVVVNPQTGVAEQMYSYDAAGNRVPVKFPSIEAYYQYRSTIDGTVDGKIAEARRGAAQSVAQAIQRRDATVTEVGSDYAGPVDGKLTPEQAVKLMESIDEEAAVLRANDGDRTLLDTLNRALVALGHSPISL